MYAVTGATGQLGRLVIAALAQRVAPDSIVALARDPDKAAGLAQLGVTVRRFDYDQPDQLAPALAGVTRLLLISSDDPQTRMAQHRAVIDAAVQARVSLIAYTSIIHADTNPISLSDTHRESERLIAASGLRHAILRNSWYIENYLAGVDATIEHGVLIGSTGSGRISAATRGDYAEAAAIVLAGDASEDRTHELAGDEAFTLADLAAALAEVSGRPVVYQDLTEAAYCDALIGAGVPAGFAAALAEYGSAASGGILADDSHTLSRLLGRPTETLRHVLRRTLPVRTEV